MIFVKDFFGLMQAKVARFDNLQIVDNVLYCVMVNQPSPNYFSSYMSIFLSFST